MQLDNVLNVRALMCSKQSQIFLLKTYTTLQCAAAHRNNKAPPALQVAYRYGIPGACTANSQCPQSKCLAYKDMIKRYVIGLLFLNDYLIYLYILACQKKNRMKFICNAPVTAFPRDLARFNLDIQLLHRSFQVALLLNSPR